MTLSWDNMLNSSYIKRVLTICIIVFFTDLVTAQDVNIDSLKALLPEVHGVERVDLKNGISRRLIYVSPGEADTLIREAIKEGHEIDYKEGLALAMVLKGTLENNRSEFAKAKNSLNEAINMSMAIDYQEGLAYARLGLGALYIRTRELTLAFENHLEGIEAAKQIGNLDLELTYLMNIGVIKQLLEDFDESERYFQEALIMSEKAKLPNRSAQIYGNLGIVSFKRQNYGSAINYQRNALALFKELSADTQSAISLLNIGLAQSKLGKFNEAAEAYNETLDLRTEMSDSLGIARVFRYKGELRLEMKEYSLAAQYLKEALSIAENFNDQNLLSEIHELHYQLYQSQADFKKALESYESYVLIKDSLTARANESKISELTTQYDFGQLENQNRLQQQENKIKDLKIAQRNNLILGFVAILVLVVIWGFWNRKRLEGQLAITRKDQVIAEKEIELRAKEFDSERAKLVLYANQLLSKNDELEGKRLQLEQKITSNQAEKNEIGQLIEKLRDTISDQKDWAAFKLYFDAVFPDFFENLKANKTVELTMHEKRLLCLIKISLSNKEIGGILNISRSSVVRAKYRLRQKFDFADTKELEDLLANI